ncbi:MAG: hypothetical protein JW800_04105 [Candidatus Omnitrophica bacterium]|nr:hypothetical protein [Candidatus Omnitrophota bacterium]
MTELFVTLALIMLIVGILLPALNKAKETGKLATCLNNLRQIGQAIYLYMDDHEFKFPGVYDTVATNRWYQKLEPYIDDNEIYRCSKYDAHVYADGSHFSYGFNYRGLNTPKVGVPAFIGKDLISVKSPGQCIMVTEATGGSMVGGSSFFVEKNAIIARHKGGAPILFVDGHVAWYRLSQIPMSGAQSQIWWGY